MLGVDWRRMGFGTGGWDNRMRACIGFGKGLGRNEVELEG